MCRRFWISIVAIVLTTGVLISPNASATVDTMTFHSIEPMRVARVEHTATPLLDGTVLIAGGYNANPTPTWLSESDIYDPATSHFHVTGGLQQRRAEHTATRLRDGRVLIVGGRIGNTAVLSSTEIYSPTAHLFSFSGSLHEPRVFHTATLLQDGRVLITGGFAGNNPTLIATAEVYNPRTGIFTKTGTMHDARAFHAATLLQNGDVLVTGGRGNDQAIHASAEVYNPRSGVFRPVGNLTVARSQQAAVRLPSGLVLVIGGYNYSSDSCPHSAEMYDPSTEKFHLVASPTFGRASAPAFLTSHGDVLVIAGVCGGDRPGAVELYESKTKRFRTIGDLIEQRGNLFAAALLPHNSLIVTGGLRGETLNTTEVGKFVTISTPSVTRTSTATLTQTPERTPSITPTQISTTGLYLAVLRNDPQPTITPTETPSPTQTQTSTVIPTDTTQPTPTTTPSASPTNAPAGIGGTVLYKGKLVGDVGVELWLCTPTTECPTVATTRSDAAGHYFFPSPMTLPPDALYRVAFLNATEEGNTPNPDRIGGMVGPAITTYTRGAAVLGGVIDITNVYLIRPAPGATVRFPATFEWTSRGISSDYFAWSLYDINGNPICMQDPPQTGTSIVLSLNVAAQTDCDIAYNTSYLWDVWVVTNGLYRDGYGQSFNAYRVVFASSGLTAGHEPAGGSKIQQVDARHLRRLGLQH